MMQTELELPREELQWIARRGIREARARDMHVSRALEREIKEAAATTDAFALGTYGRTDTCRCLIGETRHRRGERPMPDNDVEDWLGIRYNDLVFEAVGDDYGAAEVVRIV